MTGVRVLVGTRKGAFVLTADGARMNWEVSGPFFPDWEVYQPRRVTERAEPNLGRLVRRLVRSAGTSLGRRGRHLGAGRQRVPLRHRPGTHQW
jgi:hypothetical protein